MVAEESNNLQINRERKKRIWTVELSKFFDLQWKLFLIVKSCSRHIVFCRHFYHFSKAEYNPWNRAVDCFEHWRNLTPCWEFLSKWISKSFHNFLSNITICILIRCSLKLIQNVSLKHQQQKNNITVTRISEPRQWLIP